MPGESIELHIGFVAGTGSTGFWITRRDAQPLFDGLWFDIDRDPGTGVEGRETQVHWMLGGRRRFRPPWILARVPARILSM